MWKQDWISYTETIELMSINFDAIHVIDQQNIRAKSIKFTHVIGIHFIKSKSSQSPPVSSNVESIESDCERI